MTVVDGPADATDQVDVVDVADVVRRLRQTHASGRTRSYAWRMEQLTALVRMLEHREQDIVDALAEDLGRPPVEAWLGDIASTKGELDFAIKHLKEWMKPQRHKVPLTQLPAKAWVQYEPLGTVLVIGPWNYPVLLSLAPVAAAISAGNCVVLKPSEVAPASSALLARLLPQYVDPDAVKVVEGGAEVTQELLAQGMDHAFFTGGTEVGKKIMAAAAPSLTPVTLELGGKSPAIVTSDADLDVVARRIAWVKFMNSGQTCIAPDYVLVERAVRDELVMRLVDAARSFRYDQASAGLPIVNRRQLDRLAGYIDATEGVIQAGGLVDPEALTIAPTIVVDPALDEPMMTEEIFGPILPVVSIDSVHDVPRFVNARPKPLGLYVYTGDEALARDLIDQIPAGGAVINHSAMHHMVPSLPFGGVGASGMGAYHGRWGFETFSHRKSVLAKTFTPDLRIVYPPYGEKAAAIMRKLF